VSGRTPWLGARSSGAVPFGAMLPRAGAAHGTTWPRAEDRAGGDDASRAGAPDHGAAAGSHDRDDAQAALERARAEAIREGREAGRRELARVRDVLAAAATTLTRAAAHRDEAMTELVVDLALGLCAELAPAAAAIDRRGLVQLVHRAIADAGGQKARDLVLRMCAEDVAAVGDQLPSGVTCEVGADLVPGEVWIEAPRLVVDGRWSPRLAALREPLIALVRDAEPAFELATPDPETGDGA